MLMADSMFKKVNKINPGFLLLSRYLLIGFLALSIFGLAAVNPVLAPVLAKVTQVPAGNRNADQPPIPYGALSRTKKTKGSFDGKFDKIYNLLAKNKKLIRKIRKSATTFNIDPIHIVGALIGEHTYNVDALDRMQTYYVKAMAYLGSDLTFKHAGEKVTIFVARPQFFSCFTLTDSYDLWACRENVWNSLFRGKTVDGTAWPNDRFGRVFFQPLYAGQTFGLGQMNPLTALRVTDIVAKKTRSRKLDPNKAPQIYKEIMNPDSTLNYMAAVIRASIDAYQNIAGFDISNNPGLTATLYNLGDVRNRARVLAEKNKIRRGKGKKISYPEENYYGWLINERETALRSLL
jgi:hypothetical protein